MNRLRAGLAASTTVLAILATTPAHAEAVGGGVATGTYSCVAGTASFTVDAPVFRFNGETGALQITGVTSCTGASILADSGVGTFDVQGPGVTCDSVGGAWTGGTGELRLFVGGDCAYAAGGGENMSFFLEAVAANGIFAGPVVVTPPA